MRIICGTDFSKPAAQAANAAAALAARWKETLVLAHSVENAGLGASSPKVFDLLSASIREKLHTEAERLRTLGPVVKEELLTGPPDEALVKLARPRTTRLIVVSSLGRRAPGRWLLGSVSERTAERATVPTLVVRDAAPFAAWARGERPLKVFVAFNFTVTSEAALRWVGELQQAGPCEIVVGYVDWPPEERARLGGGGPLPLTQNPPETQRVLDLDLQAKATEVLGSAPAKVQVEPNWGRADSRLIEMAREERADLVVIGSHQYHGFERLWNVSVSRGLLHHAPMNVVVVPTATEPAHGLGAIPQLRRVLAATDFSALGDRAIPYAYATLPRGAVVKLIHVIPPWELPGPLVPHYQPKRLTEKQHQQLAADALKKLHALISAEAEARGIATELEVIEHRDVAKAIGQEAERFGADLVCLGSHGRGGLSKAVLGSVAQTVMTRSPRPLLVVRPPKP